MRAYGALVAILLSWAGLAPADAQDQLKLAVPQRGAWDTGIPELGQRAGIFKKHGIVLEIFYTSGGAESQQAVIAGSSDIATAVGVDGAVGAFAKGAPLRIIGSEIVGTPDIYWYVPATSAIKTLADVTGKTIAFSVTGSSSHSALLGLLEQNKIVAKPVATGGMPSTLTQTMSVQIDVGWAAAPFGLSLIEEGKIRVVARAADVTSRQGQSARVHVANLQTVQNRKDVLSRFMQAYRETIEWMYSDPAALKAYEEFSKVPESAMRTGRDQFFPKASLDPDRVVGIEQIMAGAVRNKFLAAPLTKEQIAEMIQIPLPPGK